MTRSYLVRAGRWSGGWELHVSDVGVTQVTTLARAEQQVRDSDAATVLGVSRGRVSQLVA